MPVPSCYRIAGGFNLYYVPMSAESTPVEFPTPTIARNYLGFTGEEGVRSNREVFIQDIVADQMGQGIVDGVFQGSNLEIEFVVQDVNRDVAAALFHPNQTTDDNPVTVAQERYGVPGALVCARLGTLYMFPIAGTPAASYIAGSATAGTNAYAFKGINVGPVVESMDTTARFVPVRFRCYPFFDTDDSNAWKHWKWVANSTEPSS